MKVFISQRNMFKKKEKKEEVAHPGQVQDITGAQHFQMFHLTASNSSAMNSSPRSLTIPRSERRRKAEPLRPPHFKKDKRK